MAKPRKAPTDRAMARVGNYVASYDPRGLSNEEKGTMEGTSQRPGESDGSYMKRQRTRVNRSRVSKGKKPLVKQPGMKG